MCAFELQLSPLQNGNVIRYKQESVINLAQKWKAQTRSMLTLQVSPDNPQRQHPFAMSLEMGHAPAGGSPQAPLSQDACLSSRSCRPKPGISFTSLFAFNSPQQKLGSRQCFQQNCATGCQVKNNLSCCKQTKQNSFQDVGLLFV